MNVEIEIPVAELKSVLPGLSKITSRSATLPVLQCIKVSLDPGEKIISLQAHNLDEIATVRIPNKANGLSGELLVPLEPISKIVKACSTEHNPSGLSARVKKPRSAIWSPTVGWTGWLTTLRLANGRR